MTRDEIVTALRCAWVPVTERLPENAKHPGALCPVYLVATKYGVTEGWYNPDVRGWFIIVKRLTGLYDGECDINFEKGDVVRVEYAKDGIVTHWMPMPEVGECAIDALSAAADLIENQQREIEALRWANEGVSGDEICRAALEAFGERAQMTMAIEEMSELAKELCKRCRGRDNVEAIAEEIADVEIMLQQMVMLFDCAGQVETFHRYKLERLAGRIEEAKEHEHE